MSNYLLIESHDAFETQKAHKDFVIAAGLAKAGNDVTLFLVQNGVLSARKNARSESLQKAINDGVKVLSDAFSLKERGISDTDLMAGTRSAPLETVIDRMVDGSKTLWL